MALCAGSCLLGPLGFLGNMVGQEAGSTPLARVEPARSGDFKFTRVNKLSLKVSSPSCARGHNVTMLTSTTHVFGSCSGWSWLRISAIAKDFLGISRVSSSGVETVVVPQSLCSSTIPVDPYLWDTPDSIQGLSITGHAIHECYASFRDIPSVARSMSADFDDDQLVGHK